MSSHFEQQLGERTQELEAAREALRLSEERLALEIEASLRLQQVATRLATAEGTQALYEQILDATQSLLRADFASIQVFHTERGTGGSLRLLSHRGFSAEAAERWQWVTPFTRTTCGEALRTRRRIVVPDVQGCGFMEGSEDLAGFLAAGIRAGQTTPLLARSGALLGMVTTYWRQPHELSATELRCLDVLARLAADLIERSRAEEALRENEQRLASIYDTVRDVIFHLAVEPEGRFRFVSVNAAFLKTTGLSRETVVGKTVNDVIPEPSLTMVLGKYRRAIEEKSAVLWEETSDYPTGRLTGEVCVVPVFDDKGVCTHLVGSVHDVTGRKRAEGALRESEQRFRILADSAPVLIWVAGTDKLCTFFNKPWLDFTGRTMEQELGDGWASGVHPDDLDRCWAIYSSSFDGRRGFQMEYRLRRFDGEYRWILDQGEPLYRSGEFTGYVGSCIDVSEHKFAIEQLQTNEARLKDAQRLARIGSWQRDIETGKIQWTDEMFRIFGRSSVFSNFNELLDYVHPGDREKVLEIDSRVRSSTAPLDIQYRLVRPDGELRFVRAIIEGVRNERGVLVRVVGATQDITEQVKAGERLRESEERLKSAERLTHAGNWHWNIKTNRFSWSEETFRIFGQPATYTPTYEGFVEQIIPADRARVATEIRNTLERRGGHSIDFRIARPNGEQRTIRCVFEVVPDETGGPNHLFGACQDITDSRRAQEESFARQKLETVGTLASGIAHDFNNLLGAVLAQAELAEQTVGAGLSPEEELEAIRDVALRGSGIVRQLMIYAGKESESLGLVNVSQVAAQMLPLLRLSVSKLATLKTELDENLPAVRANTSQISQVLMNLVTNGSEAIGERDGMIRLTTRRMTIAQGSPQFERFAAGDYIEIDVSDTGSGVPSEMQARVFDPFFSTKSPGRGLGLAVVYGIVRDLGGEIYFTSEAGQGTRVQILLPCAEALDGTISAPVSHFAEPVRQLKSATVLLVEDEDLLRQAASLMLGKEGFSVIEARDGSAALEVIRERDNSIDVLFLDATLPGTASRDVLSEARRLRPDIRVIATSAYPAEMTATSLKGATERFIRKPYRVSELVGVIRDVVS